MQKKCICDRWMPLCKPVSTDRVDESHSRPTVEVCTRTQVHELAGEAQYRESKYAKAKVLTAWAKQVATRSPKQKRESSYALVLWHQIGYLCNSRVAHRILPRASGDYYTSPKPPLFSMWTQANKNSAGDHA